jgi:hypothetical protein
VKRIAGSEYLLTMTGTELDLIRSALREAERLSRFGMKVLDQADRSQNGSPKNSRLRQTIDALAVREASLRSLRMAMSEDEHDSRPTPSRRANHDQVRFAAPLLVPLPRQHPGA